MIFLWCKVKFVFTLCVLGINSSAMFNAKDGEDDSEGDNCMLMVDGYTPLHWAVENNDIENVRMLLNHNADVNIAASFDKHSGVTALHLASQVLLEHLLFVCCLYKILTRVANNFHSNSIILNLTSHMARCVTFAVARIHVIHRPLAWPRLLLCSTVC